MTTTGYQAGVESNDVVVRYAKETVYGTMPAVPFQNIRTTGETLGGTKTRSRPAELNASGEVSGSVTTQVQGGGGINYALSYGTYDDFFASGVNGDWQTPLALAGVSGDISITTGTNALSSTTASKFIAIEAGQWIRLFGFTNAANNGIFLVLSKTNDTHLVLSTGYTSKGVAIPFVTETPAGAAAQIRASTLVNARDPNTLFIEKQDASDLLFQYPGSYISQFTVAGGAGQFLNGAFTILSANEQSATATGSTGAVVAAPTGPVFDPVEGFLGTFLDGVGVGGGVSSFEIQVAASGSALEFAMGTASAVGLILGLIEVTGTLKVYFKTMDLYNRFISEAQTPLSFVTKDAAGNAYVFTILSCALMNPQIQASAVNQSVMASFTLEGNPQTGGGSIRIDRLPAT